VALEELISKAEQVGEQANYPKGLLRPWGELQEDE
jgi:hypothetical protein